MRENNGCMTHMSQWVQSLLVCSGPVQTTNQSTRRASRLATGDIYLNGSIRSVVDFRIKRWPKPASSTRIIRCFHVSRSKMDTAMRVQALVIPLNSYLRVRWLRYIADGWKKLSLLQDSLVKTNELLDKGVDHDKVARHLLTIPKILQNKY